MAKHTASVIVHAPVEQVYAAWTSFPEYPKFMSHVRSVSYIDGEKTRWIVNVVGRHEWAARNENWIPGRQIGWRSIDGLENSGLVAFAPRPDGATEINVMIEYTPPAGFLGRIGEVLGAGKAFEHQLRADLVSFAERFEAPVRRRDLDREMRAAREREGRGAAGAYPATKASTLGGAVSSMESRLEA
jgi:uncharacterized membrane protein